MFSVKKKCTNFVSCQYSFENMDGSDRSETALVVSSYPEGPAILPLQLFLKGIGALDRSPESWHMSP